MLKSIVEHMKNTKIVEDVFLEMVFIIVDVAVLIYGTLERSNREYNNVITIKERKTFTCE